MKPPNAPTVWFEDQTLCVELPGTGELGHVIKLEGEEQWPRLWGLLQARAPGAKLGEPGDPTQYQLDKQANALLAKANGHRAQRVRSVEALPPETRSKIDEILRELGIC